jgi:hypothetical protein
MSFVRKEIAMREYLYMTFSFICVSFLLVINVSAQDLSAMKKSSLESPSSSQTSAAEVISRTRGLFGIGVVLGEPTGISGKYWLSEHAAVDGAFGYSFGDRFRFSMDYLVHTDAFEDHDFPFYYGIGGAMAGSRGYLTRSRTGDFALGVRGVIGVSYLFKRVPLDAFLEIAPIIFVAPPLGISMDFCFGLRVYP